MKYQIAGIDVHKRILAVVIADIAVEGEFQFERRMVGTSPSELCRRILHFNVTLHPTSEWIQLREAFPLSCPYRYVLFDHDSKCGSGVVQFFTSSALKPMRTMIRSPWQNGVAER